MYRHITANDYDMFTIPRPRYRPNTKQTERELRKIYGMHRTRRHYTGNDGRDSESRFDEPIVTKHNWKVKIIRDIALGHVLGIMWFSNTILTFVI